MFSQVTNKSHEDNELESFFTKNPGFSFIISNHHDLNDYLAGFSSNPALSCKLAEDFKYKFVFAIAKLEQEIAVLFIDKIVLQ